MAITKKTPKEIENLRICGKYLARILDDMCINAVAGASTGEINDKADAQVREAGCVPVLVGYTPYGAKTPYPSASCISINNEVVHGIPSHYRILQEGDIVTLDLTISYNGMICDSARTVIVGKPKNKEATKLVEATKVALDKALKVVKAGNTVGDIGFVIDSHVQSCGFKTIRMLAGHGVGHAVHEDPYVPNQGVRGKGEILQAGMVLAIEPIVAESTEHVHLLRDGYTYVTSDDSMSAHFEHTVVVTEDGVEVLTR